MTVFDADFTMTIGGKGVAGAADFAVLMEPSNAGVEADCQGTLRAEICAGSEPVPAALPLPGGDMLPPAAGEHALSWLAARIGTLHGFEPRVHRLVLRPVSSGVALLADAQRQLADWQRAGRDGLLLVLAADTLLGILATNLAVGAVAALWVLRATAPEAGIAAPVAAADPHRA